MTSETLNYKLPLLLHIATVTTGLIDAISYLGLGHVFTANMTGNVVFLAFARNVTVRKMAVPDLTTTVLTLTITGLAADSHLPAVLVHDGTDGFSPLHLCSWEQR